MIIQYEKYLKGIRKFFIIRHLKFSESEKSNRATSVALKEDKKRIKLQNEAKKKIIAMIKEIKKNQLVIK